MRSASAIYCFQSRALVPRSFFDEIASHAYGLFRLPSAPPALEELPPVGQAIEHPAVSRRRGGSDVSMLLAFAFRSSVKAYSSLAFAIDRIGVVPVAPSLMHRLANPFALAHASPWRQGRPAAEPVKTPPLYDPTRLPSKGALLRLAPLRHPPRTPWNLVPRHASLLGSSGFAATRPRTTPLH
jgi:hypothetical protein